MASRDHQQGDESPIKSETAKSPSLPEEPPARSRLILAASTAFLWIFGLAALALSTANEPMLNRLQVQQANYIVTGKILDVEQGTVSVVKQWKPTAPIREAKSITIRNLAETKARNGSTYLLPLSHVNDDTFEVSRPQLSTERHTAIEHDRPPRIYDATEHAFQQLREMLRE